MYVFVYMCRVTWTSRLPRYVYNSIINFVMVIASAIIYQDERYWFEKILCVYLLYIIVVATVSLKIAQLHPHNYIDDIRLSHTVNIATFCLCTYKAVNQDRVNSQVITLRINDWIWCCLSQYAVFSIVT